MFRYSEVGMLVQENPKKAAAVILEALRDEKMHNENAAKRLGTTHRTLLRWIEKLGLQVTIEKLATKAKKEGWHHGRNRLSPGRPRLVNPG